MSDVPYQKTLCIEVGHGSFGIVHQARNLKTDTIVAVKQIKEIYSPKRQGAARKELSMLDICDHANIVKLLDAYQLEEDPSTFYLVMEPWAPYTLHKFLRQDESQRLRESPWFSQGSHKAERQMIRIFRGLADGLSYLHEMSIKHKDLKPENILLYDDGLRGIRPIIADLGISKIFKKGNPTDYTGSTYAFLAPEQIKRVGSTLRSDIWQLGCCFALTLSVFRQGSAGCTQLWNSIERTDEACSCNIALEANFFMETLESLCGHGTESQLCVYRLTVGMLELEPEQRYEIKTVKMILAKL
jgi:serine/threonine protein kinase